MTWGAGQLRWVRPLQRILCVFDRRSCRFSIDGIEAATFARATGSWADASPSGRAISTSTARRLAADFVVLDAAERKARILEGASAALRARGLELVEDEGLLDEVAGLAEWPVPLLGDMDPASSTCRPR